MLCQHEKENAAKSKQVTSKISAAVFDRYAAHSKITGLKKAKILELALVEYLEQASRMTTDPELEMREEGSSLVLIIVVCGLAFLLAIQWVMDLPKRIFKI